MNAHDPVDDFFAQERAALTPLPATPEHWEAIVAEHRAARRVRWFSYAAGAAAAVLVATGLGYAVLGDRSADPTIAAPDQTSQPVSPTAPLGTSQVGSASETTSPSRPLTTVSSAPVTRPVPSDFAVQSVSNGGAGRVFALGTTTSKGSGLPAVARSTDEGATWQLTASIPGPSTPGRQATGQVGNDTSYTQIRMASPEVGYLFGGLSARTTDGGFNWVPFPVPGGSVLALETDGKVVAIASSTGSCDGLTCEGDLLISLTSVGADRVELPTWTIPQTSPLRSATLSWLNGSLFLSVETEAGRTAGALTEDGFKPVTVTACGDTQAASSVAVPAGGGAIVAICTGGVAAGSTSYGVASSPDGATWSVATASDKNALRLASGQFLALAGADRRHLVAVSGGTADYRGSLKVSADGGLTWADAATPPPTPDRGWFWVGSPGARQFYALPTPSAGWFWRSMDLGATWSKVQVARLT